jgi:hypothetical protein
VPDATASVSAAAFRAVVILFGYLIAAIIIAASVNAWAVSGLGRTRSWGSSKSEDEARSDSSVA